MSRLSGLLPGGRRNRQVALSVGSFVLGLSVLGCDDDPSAPQPPAESNLRVLHLSPDAPSVDVFLNESSTPAVSNLAFGEGTAYLQVAAGSYRVDVSGNGNQASESVLSIPSVALESGRYYTGVAFDRVATIQAVALEDNYENLASGNIRVRAVHAAPAVGQVDIWNIPATASPSVLYENVDFGTAGAYLDIPAGAYTLGFDVNDDAAPDVTFSIPALPAGTVANVFAVSSTSGGVFLLAQLQNGAIARIDAN